MAKAAEKPAPKDDPYNIHARLEKLISSVLDEWEEHPEMFATKDKLSVVQIFGMYLTRNLKLRDADDVGNSGSAVRRYSSAFRVSTPNAPSRGKGSAGRSRPALVTSDESDDTDDFDPAA